MTQFMLRLALAMMIGSALVPWSHAQERKLEPVDEARRDLSWAMFKNQLLDAVVRRDRKFVLSILDRNVRFGRREIDLVIRRADVIAFVEVKGRAGAGFGHPLEAITWKKRREIATVALWWIQRFGEPGLSYRFDAVAVEPARDGSLAFQHVEDAWRLD